VTGKKQVKRNILVNHIFLQTLSCFYFLFICLWPETNSIVWTHTAERRLIKTDKTERSTRHWSWKNHRVTDTFCNCIEDRTI